jgi:hypothetical protein
MQVPTPTSPPVASCCARSGGVSDLLVSLISSHVLFHITRLAIPRYVCGGGGGSIVFPPPQTTQVLRTYRRPVGRVSLTACRAEPLCHLAWRGRGQYIVNRRGRGNELREGGLCPPPSALFLTDGNSHGGQENSSTVWEVVGIHLTGLFPRRPALSKQSLRICACALARYWHAHWQI